MDRGGSPAGDPLDRSPARHRANTDEKPQFRLIHSPRKPVSGLWEVTEVDGEKPPRHRENTQTVKRKTGAEIWTPNLIAVRRQCSQWGACSINTATKLKPVLKNKIPKSFSDLVPFAHECRHIQQHPLTCHAPWAPAPLWSCTLLQPGLIQPLTEQRGRWDSYLHLDRLSTPPPLGTPHQPPWWHTTGFPCPLSCTQTHTLPLGQTRRWPFYLNVINI